MYIPADLEFFKARLLDKSVPIPIYFQLIEILQDYINCHDDNYPIPTESELCGIYEISRPTVRQAITELAQEGLIVRYKGRGSFIKKKKIVHDFLLNIISFNDEMHAKGMTPETKVLSFCSRKASPEVVNKLQAGSSDELYFLSRIRSINNEPIVLVNSYLPAGLLHGLLEKDMARESLYHVIEQDFGHHILRTHRSLEIRKAGAYEASLLKIREGDAVHFIETTAFIEDGRPIEFSTAYYNGERNKFIIEVRTNS